MESGTYKYDDSNPENIKVTREAKTLFVCECNGVSQGGMLYEVVRGTLVNCSIKTFHESGAPPTTPVCDVKVRVDRGILSQPVMVFNGTNSQVDFTWQAPDETVEVNFSAKVEAWSNKEYTKGKVMIIELINP